MAPSTLALSEKLALPVVALKNAALEPLLTGPLLLALLRGPARVQQVLLRPFEGNVLATDRTRKLAVAIKALKVLFALGLASRVNQTLNAWALNQFYLTKQGVPWRFTGTQEIVLITGGCSGFGYHMVKGFAGKAKVVVVDVQDLPDDLRRLPNVRFYKCDLTSNDDIHVTAAAIRSEVGSPSVLINNAGIGTSHTILDTTPEWLDKIFRVNLLSHYTLIQEFLPAMLDARKGHVVSIASMASFVTGANLVDYCATKAGVLALHEGLNQELRHRYTNGECIQTTIVHPMWARTAIIKDWEVALAKSGQAVMPPEQVSDRVVAQVLSGRSGQLFLPQDAARASGARGWPHWLQDLLRGGVQSATKRNQ